MRPRRSIHQLVPVLVLALAAGCQGAGAFDIARDLPEQGVRGDVVACTAGSAVPNFSPINPFMLEVNLQSEARAMGTPVMRVFLSSLTFTISQTSVGPGDTDNFDFVESVTLRVESARAGTQLPPTDLATGGRQAGTQTYVLTPVPGLNLKPYIDEGIRITSTSRGIPPCDDVSFNGRIVLRAEPL